MSANRKAEVKTTQKALDFHKNSVGEYMRDKDTSFPCPNCGSHLQWQYTGIS
jgi:predicted RNA-binding Zn-ribbon protein involved in translation (DUF1610 family)